MALRHRYSSSSRPPAYTGLATLALAGALITTLIGCQQFRHNSAADPASAAGSGADDRGLGIAIENMDPSVRPQDDFFQYVNGTWLANTEIPADKSRYGVFDELQDQSESRQRQIIEDVASKDRSARDKAEQQVGDLFHSFMDQEAIDGKGLSPIQPLIDRIDGIKSRRELTAELAQAYGYGVNGPVVFWVGVDAKNTEEYIIYITQSGLGLPDRDYYFREDARSVEIRQKYLAFIGDILGLADFDENRALADRIMALETMIAEGQWDRVENRNRDKTYTKFTVDELKALTPAFTWDDYFGAVDVRVKEVVVRQPSYLESLNALYDSATLDDWKLYLKWQLINTHLSYLSEPFDAANFDFYSKTLRGTEKQRDRWKRAVRLVNRSIGELVGKVYVDRHFKPEAKARMEELVENLGHAFKQGIDELEWMGDETKVEARRKLAKFTRKIGYPDKWRDYSELEIDPQDLIGNVHRISVHEMEYELARLGGPIDRSEWHMTPQTVNAYYNSSLNEIVFPAAILQPPFFNLEADDAVNYGAIGAVIGHEISHGFDDQGRKSDGDGNLRDWWSNEDAAAFKDRANILVAQYNNYYPLPEMHINGELTLGENIGDVSGVAIAYQAYQISLNGKQAPVIDGFTGDQRFFMGFAQVFRGRIRDEALATRIQTDPHSPSRYRVLGVVSNMPAFYAAFDVKEGDALYRSPQDRVKIW